MSDDPENQDTEELTDEERRALGVALTNTLAVEDMPEARNALGMIAKLLRIHDAQRERIAELERLLNDPREFLCTCGHLRGEPHRPGCPALP